MSLLAIEQAPGTSGSLDQGYLRHSSRSYLALYNVDDDETFVVLNCGIALHAFHPGDTQQRVIGISAELVAARTSNPADGTLCSMWKIAVEYGPWNPLEYPADGNPLNLPVRYRMEFTVAEVAAFEDVGGNPIVNSAGDPYDPPLMREVGRCTLTVLRNESPATIDLATLAATSNTINRADWNGFPAKTVKLAPIKMPDIAYSQATGAFYYPMEYVFDVNFDTWTKQVVNAGFRQLDGSGNLVPILINGQPPSTPVPLDEAGHAILTPSFSVPETGGDVPPESDPGGYPGEVPGGGEPPKGGTGVASGSSLVIDAYDLIRASDFTALRMDSLFTLPPLLS